MPTDLIYDISVEEERSEWGKCIHAPERMFEVVAGLLFKLATEKPDASQEVWLKRGLVIDYDMQAALFAFATQLLTAELCIDGGDMRLRQKPSNPCILQQEQGGDWVDVFDYSLCMASLGEAIDEISDQLGDDRVKDGIIGAPQQLEDLYRDFLDRYEGTSASYDPALTNMGGASDSAICAAIKEMVDQACRDSLNLKTAEADSIDRTALAVGVGIAIVGVLALFVTGGAAAAAAPAFFSSFFTAGSLAISSAVLGLTAASLAVWAQAVKDTSAATFNNGAAKNEIVCEWFAQLSGEEDISQEEYAAELDMSSASADAQSLYAALKPLMQDQAVYYAAFLKAWKRESQFNAAGIDSSCICEPPAFNIVAVPGWDHWVPEYRGRFGDDNEIHRWRITRTANTGFGSAVMSTAEAVAFEIVDDRIIEGNFTTKCNASLAPVGNPTQVELDDHFIHDTPVWQFYRVADGPMPQVWEVDVKLAP